MMNEKMTIISVDTIEHEFWEYENAKWSKYSFIDPEGDGSPSHKSYYSITFDSSNNLAVMFGGVLSDETWVFNSNKLAPD